MVNPVGDSFPRPEAHHGSSSPLPHRNKDVRESCIEYIDVALEHWAAPQLEFFKIPLQTSIAVRFPSSRLERLSPECYDDHSGVRTH